MRTDALYKFKTDRVNLKLIISPNIEIKKRKKRKKENNKKKEERLLYMEYEIKSHILKNQHT